MDKITSRITVALKSLGTFQILAGSGAALAIFLFAGSELLDVVGEEIMMDGKFILIAALLCMFLEEIPPEDCLILAADAEQRCQAYYYVARFHLLKGDTSRAQDLLEKCAPLNMPHLFEYACAREELRQLRSVRP